MKLKNLIQNIPGLLTIKGNIDQIEINEIKFDSRKVEPNDLFVAIKGTNTDGHKFIPQAIDKGAAAIVAEICPQNYNIPCIQVQNSKIALAKLADNYFNSPSKKLKLIGVTGTNGKTTIATSLYFLFENLGYNAGLISTIRYLMHDMQIPATHTTPDPITINYVLNRMVEKNCSYAFMEVSSHALDQHRTDFLDFDAAIFTNITHEHLDYHKTFKNYLYAKKKLFDSLKPQAFALVNADDPNSKVITQNTKAKVYTFGLKNFADFKAKILEKHFDGTLILIDGQEVWIKLLGTFNVYNILAVYATAILLGIDKFQALQAISNLNPVNGRFQLIQGQERIVIIDYAHTPDALQKILAEIKDIRQPHQRIITVFGAGGNRDKQKRPLMGKIASQLSDIVVITSDNPRFEDPLAIIQDIKQGVENNTKVLEIPDRREAIRTALTISQPQDIILIAGKGHETYQEINGQKFHFDDKEVVKEFLNL